MKYIIILSLLVCLLIVRNVHAAFIDEGMGKPVPTSSYQKVQNQQQKSIEAVFKLFNQTTDPLEGTPTSPPAQQGPTISPTISVEPTAVPYATLPPGNNQSSSNCPPASTRLNVAGTQYQHLTMYLPCDPPTRIVLHWSASWSSAQGTYNSLNELKNRGDTDENGNSVLSRRSCHFAVDPATTIQMMDFYPNAIEHPWCAGPQGNAGAINIEITGAWFDQVLERRPTSQSGPVTDRQYNDLMRSTERTVAVVCNLLKMYPRISKTSIYGHYQFQEGKSDPGPKYLQFFKNEVVKKCI